MVKIKTIKSENLEVGMYVKFASWFKHPFMRGSFLIKNQKQIDDIIKSGLKEVDIDVQKSINIIKSVSKTNCNDSEIKSFGKLDHDKLVTDELKEVINDKSLARKEKASTVYKSSTELMDKLFKNPTAENLSIAKDGIISVVDYILANSDMAVYMLNIRFHDFYTYNHSVNVGIFSTLVAKEIYGQSDANNMQELGAGFFLHDIGKTKINTDIINKPGRLTETEMGIMRSHPYQGYKVLEESDLLSEECKIIVMQHHEREDGTGYPRRLNGDEIHPYGKITCIADVFDALTSKRSYKPPMTPYNALTLMKEEMFNQFNEEIFTKFVFLFMGLHK